jgi:N-methylhydantoinase B
MEFGVRVEGYSIHTDSGGRGCIAAACGIVRDLRVIGDEAIIGVRMDNIRWPAWGVKGGMGGGAGRIVVNPGTPNERELRPMSEGNRLKKGDLVRIMTSGGGGWGSPLERSAEQVRDDVLDGFILAESASRDYGVVPDRRSGRCRYGRHGRAAEGTRAHEARPVSSARLFR